MLNNYLTTYCPDDAFQELVELSSEDPLSTPELAIVWIFICRSSLDCGRVPSLNCVCVCVCVSVCGLLFRS